MDALLGQAAKNNLHVPGRVTMRYESHSPYGKTSLKHTNPF